MSKSPKYAQVRLAAEAERELARQRAIEEQRREHEAKRQLEEQHKLADRQLKARSVFEFVRQRVAELRASADAEGFSVDDPAIVERLRACEEVLALQKYDALRSLTSALDESLSRAQHEFDDWRDTQRRRSLLVGALYEALSDAGFFVDPRLIRNVPGPTSVDTVIVPAQRADGAPWDIVIAEGVDSTDRIEYRFGGLAPDGDTMRVRCPSVTTTIDALHKRMQTSGLEFTRLTWDEDDGPGKGGDSDTVPEGVSTLQSHD